ncbi:transposase, partial [Trueperella sp. HMSC08B05]
LDKARELRESGSTTAQILTELGISEATLNRWQATYGAMSRSEAKELQRLRDENTHLKRLLGQAELEKAAWKELAEGNF